MRWSGCLLTCMDIGYIYHLGLNPITGCGRFYIFRLSSDFIFKEIYTFFAVNAKSTLIGNPPANGKQGLATLANKKQENLPNASHSMFRPWSFHACQVRHNPSHDTAFLAEFFLYNFLDLKRTRMLSTRMYRRNVR
jgi:hypothetical protein